MAKVTQFLSGNFIKSDDVKAAPIVADIVNTKISEFTDAKTKKTEQKLTLVLIVKGEEKQLTINNSIIKALIAAFGDDDDNWKGRRIVIYHDPSVLFGGKAVGGVRVKVPGVKTEADKAREAAEAAVARALEAESAPASATPAPAPSREPGDDDIPF